jgi:hypothetical protein
MMQRQQKLVEASIIKQTLANQIQQKKVWLQFAENFTTNN